MQATILYFAWSWILVGMIAGAAIGMFFHRHDWLGGFDAWPRRMVRLGHIAFLGTGLLNLAFAFSIPVIAPDGAASSRLELAGVFFVIGAVAMPSICFLSAWRKPMRHLFFIPAGSLITAVVLLLTEGIMS